VTDDFLLVVGHFFLYVKKNMPCAIAFTFWLCYIINVNIVVKPMRETITLCAGFTDFSGFQPERIVLC